jgi:ribosomal protein S18 acetylase RimI-like enzyme
MAADFTIRRANPSDLPVLGRLGAMLMHVHFAFDPQRFIAPSDHAAEGYSSFLGTQLRRKDVAIFVAEREAVPCGYVYAGIEPRNWKELRDASGFIHDVVVDEQARRQGVAAALIDAALEWLRAADMPRVVLWTADQNDSAQRLFDRLGFRRTMIEMTREL